ncbi:hypothetical protein EIP91_007728 [Steccherinum ochraceum]|uniref:Protein kinase domain-containing protein n=1 Tax=Steccherinum ochraceum TaxID=92696 RepID=A0A4R0RHW6_9APHY|nr:hypothetical protein EIP91_007728 [Steccherinum ochraceum]
MAESHTLSLKYSHAALDITAKLASKLAPSIGSDFGLTLLFEALSILYKLHGTMKENREECLQLADHVNAVYTALLEYRKVADQPPENLVRNVRRLASVITDINRDLAALKKASFAKRLLCSPQISERVREAYRRLKDAVSACNLAVSIDIRCFEAQNAAARELDTKKVDSDLKQVLYNERKILKLLDVGHREMQEAIVSMSRRIQELPDGLSRHFLQQGVEAMRRQSQSTYDVREDLLISELEVIVHRGPSDTLGEGGFGTVFKGTYHGSLVAVKELLHGIDKKMIMRELHIWGKLKHPNILTLYGGSPSCVPPFFVCAYMHHGNASQYLKHNPDANRRKLLHEASMGLAYLHSRDVIHRDLKAANILVNVNGTACLSDFGLSEIKRQTTSVRNTVSVEQASRGKGTLSYMAPEQFGQAGPNKRTDIYSFAITMWEVYTLQTPFMNLLEPVALFLHRVGTVGERPPKPEHFERMDTDLWELMQEGWSKYPEARPSALELSNRIGRLSVMTRDPMPPHSPSSATSLPKASASQLVPLAKRTGGGDITHHGRRFASRPAVPPSAYSPPSSLPRRTGNVSQNVPVHVPVVHGVPARDINGAYSALAGVHPSSFAEVTTLHYPGQHDAFLDYSSALPLSSNDATPLNSAHLRSRSFSSFRSTAHSPPPSVWRRIERRLCKMVANWPMETVMAAWDGARAATPYTEISLSIWMLQMFKRYVREREEQGKSPMSAVHCHVVLPFQVAAVDVAIRDNALDGGIAVLREFWNLMGQTRRPDYLLAMGRHWADSSRWVVHRFSLAQASATTYATYPTQEAPELRHVHADWWTIIRAIWPEMSRSIPTSRVECFRRQRQLQTEEPLAAACIWRNIMLGETPGKVADLAWARDAIEREIDRLLKRKQMAKLQ